MENNKVMLDLEVNSTLPVISGNFNIVKSQLIEGLKQYDLVVDDDGVKTAKAMATEINKLSGQIKAVVKTEADKLSAPIDDLRAKGNELIALCQTSRQKLLDQTVVFENKTKAECLTLLQKELQTQYSKHGVNAEFQTVTVDDLAIISNKTKTGLAKKAVDAVCDRVFEAKKFQEKIEYRLTTLMGVCLDKGLKVSFTRENINHFLMAIDDSSYEERLNSLIANELTRQKVIEEKARQEAEVKIQTENIAAQETQIQNTKPTIEVKPTQLSTPKQPQTSTATPVKSNGNMRRYTVTATFEIEVDEKFEPQLEAMLLRKFEQACFKNIPEILVVKKPLENGRKDGSLF